MGRRFWPRKCQELTQRSSHLADQVPWDLHRQQKTLEGNSFVRPSRNWKNLFSKGLCHRGWRNFLLCLIIWSDEQICRRKLETYQTTVQCSKVYKYLILEKRSLQLSLLMKSIQCVETDLMEKMKLLGESRLNFWFKCKVLAMMILEFWFWELPICHGLLIPLSEEDSKEESIYLFLNTKPDWECWGRTWLATRIPLLRKNFKPLPRELKTILDPIWPFSSETLFTSQSEDSKLLLTSSR